MKHSILSIKNEFRCALRIMAELLLPYVASCSLLVFQLLAVAAFILFGIGFIWSVMGHGNEPAWWALNTLLFAAVSGGSYMGSLLLISKLKKEQCRS